MIGKTDQTIECMCNWIQKELEKSDSKICTQPALVPEMTKALAELVSARAMIITCQQVNYEPSHKQTE